VTDMDLFPWFFGPSLSVPYTPSTTLDGKPLPTALEVELIELIYLVIADEHQCSECGHVLGRSLRVRNASAGTLSRWPVWVDTKCWGWRRHPHVAQVTQPVRDLMLGDLKLRLRST
jgi:hypothetical protein